MASFGGFDCAWVDFIAFPAFVDYTGTKEIAIGSLMMNISPNPSSEKITIDAQLSEKSGYTLQIINNEGKTVISRKESSTDNEGRTQQVIDISALTPGYYTCEIKSGKLNISRPFIVN
jgi:hypothetical protein